MIIPAQEVAKLKPITPYMDRHVTAFGMTAGQGPCTYDVRLKQSAWMWPGRFWLASTIERFQMPNDLCAQVLDKSTWARRGICVQNTFIDPGWCGYLTLEITNHSWKPQKLEAGMPICQILFSRLEAPTVLPYAGKYQDQADMAVAPIHEKRSPLGLPPATAPMPPVKPTQGHRLVLHNGAPIDCPGCKGSGRVAMQGNEVRCDVCDGWGVVQG